MEPHAVLDNVWIMILGWSALYLGDYYLTIFTARRFQDQLSDHLTFERSFELNPIFESDVNQLRLISPRFLLMWLLTSSLLLLSWWFTHLFYLPRAYQFLTGMLFLLELAVHLRHFRNLALIVAYRPGALNGRLDYAYWFGLRLSSWELFSFSAFYTLLALLESSWFLAGGALSTLILALQHRSRSKRKDPSRMNSPEVRRENLS